MADKTENKPGFFAKTKASAKGWAERSAKFFRDTKGELKKVVWPSKQDTKKNTIVVIVGCLIAGAILFALDAAFGFLLGLVIGA